MCPRPRKANMAPTCSLFPGRPGDGIVFSVNTRGSCLRPFAAAMNGPESMNIYCPQLIGRFVSNGPFRQCLAGTDNIPSYFRSRTENNIPVRSNSLWTIDQLLDSNFAQDRQSGQGQGHHRLKMVPVGIQQGRLKLFAKLPSAQAMGWIHVLSW